MLFRICGLGLVGLRAQRREGLVCPATCEGTVFGNVCGCYVSGWHDIIIYHMTEYNKKYDVVRKLKCILAGLGPTIRLLQTLAEVRGSAKGLGSAAQDTALGPSKWGFVEVLVC